MRFLVLGKADVIRMLACLVLGALLGAAGATITTGKYVDELILSNHALEHKLSEEQARLKQFEKVHSYTPVVRSIQLKLICSADKHTEQELEKKIRSLLTGLVGLKIQQLDNTILRDILHKRVIPVADENFELSLETIIIDDDLTFVVVANKRPKKALEDE